MKVLIILAAVFMAVAAHAADAPQRWYTPEHVARGAPLYQMHCAVCHGKSAEGDTNWRRRDANGKFPPPPLNGTAHTWHHPSGVLIKVIRDGSLGGGNMPAWGDKLSLEEMVTIIAWFQSHWPDEIYAAWLDLELQSRKQ